ncbi:MAG: hypothetical protein AB7P02_05130 [Alphaproteobacteria bacterium]
MPDPRYTPIDHAREEPITCADTGARLIVDRPGTLAYDKHRFRPLDRESDLLLTRRKVEDLEDKLAVATARGRDADAAAVAAQLGFARAHLDELRADPRHPLLGPSASEMVGRPPVLAGGDAKAEAA